MNFIPTSLLASTVFLSGVAFAAITPFRAIVGIDALGLSNQTFAVVMALSAGGSAGSSVVLGWLSDRLSDRRVLVLLCAFVGVLAFAILWLVQTALAFIIVFCALLPFGVALFSQSFSYSRAYYDKHLPERSEFLMSLLRSGFTLAWIVVPPAAGWLAGKYTAYSVFGVAMVAHMVATGTVALLWTQPETNIGKKKQEGPAELEPIRLQRTYVFGIPAVVMGMVALQLNLTVLPLIIIRDLSGSFEQVGFNAAFAAVLEVPIMIGWGVLALRFRKDFILAIAVLVFGAYFLGMSFVGTFYQVLAMQVLAAIAIAALLSINISYLQEVFPGRVGLSTSLLDVTMVISALLASVLFAVFAGETYQQLMVISALLCGVSAVLFWIARAVKLSQAQA